MGRPFKDSRPIGPFVQTNISSNSEDLIVYHYTDRSNLDSIMENGIKGSISDDDTDELESVLEKYRPEKYPSRTDAVFTHKDIGIASSHVDEDTALLSFKASDAPCAGYGVVSTGELMGLAHLMFTWEEEPSEGMLKESAMSFWEDDVAGPISNSLELESAQDKVKFGEIEEIYFPCDIPPEVISIVDSEMYG